MRERNWIRESINTIKNAAENGNVSAQVELAKRLFTGRDVSRDPKEGFSWIAAAAEQGDAEALHVLGHCYATGTGVQASGRKAFECFVKAAFLGNAVSAYNLGICYEYGIGTEKDSHMAYAMYRKSAFAGYAKAKHMMAVDAWNDGYLNEKFSSRDALLSWFTERARQGDELAKKELALARKNRRIPQERDLML